MSVFIHPSAEVLSDNIGLDTTIWQFVVILNNARIGTNCNINCHVFIENDVTIGNNVTIKSGVQIWDGITIEDNVFIGPNVTFTNDYLPRSKKYPEKFLRTLIKQGVSIGANSTLIGGVTIGEYAMIGAGSVVTKYVPNNTLWFGNPAKFREYVCNCGSKLNNELICPRCNTKYSIKNGKIIKHD